MFQPERTKNGDCHLNGMKNARLKKVNGATLAIAAAALLASAPISAHASSENVRCFGVNGCRGQGSCATANNQCAGQNACKGQGVLEMKREACEAEGGQAES